MENISEINDKVELPEVIFSLLTTDQYKQKDPSLLAKYINCMYKTASSHEGRNMSLTLERVRIKVLLLQYPKIIYKIKIIHMYFFQEWIEWKQRVVPICTGTA